MAVEVTAEHVTATTEVRGRLVGPRCQYAATIEVAYPMRPHRPAPGSTPAVCARLVIPEPSLWEPASPFLYEGAVELWEHGVLQDRRPVRRGFRALHLGAHGLRLNGRPFALRAAAPVAWNEKRAQDLRTQGYNGVLVDVATVRENVWLDADQSGHFVLGRLGGSREHSSQGQRLSRFTSCLGWVFSDPVTATEDKAEGMAREGTARGLPLIGVELRAAPARPLPPFVQFVVCPRSLARELPATLPKILFSSPECAGADGERLAAAGMFGTVAVA